MGSCHKRRDLSRRTAGVVLEAVCGAPCGPGRHGAGIQQNLPPCVEQIEAEAACMVIGAREPEFARSSGLAKDRPILVVSVLVGDPRVQDQVAANTSTAVSRPDPAGGWHLSSAWKIVRGECPGRPGGRNWPSW
jgi:hypothetical protein